MHNTVSYYMVQLLTRLTLNRRSADIAGAPVVVERPLADRNPWLTPDTSKRRPLVQDVAGFIKEIHELLDEVNPSDGMRDTVDGLLRRVEADPADPTTWGEARSLQVAMYSSSHRLRELTEYGPQQLSGRDRDETLMTLKFAERRGDEDAVRILQEALAVGQAAVEPQVESLQQK